MEDVDSQGDGSSQPDTISIASRTSQNTADSDKVGQCPNLPPQDFLLAEPFLKATHGGMSPMVEPDLSSQWSLWRPEGKELEGWRRYATANLPPQDFLLA